MIAAAENGWPLVYDGTIMSHYVDGAKEQESAVAFGPMQAGRTSLGVRLNQVFWFKGCIAEVRFHSRAVPAARLQRNAKRSSGSSR
jgi:hypothetical protein